MCMGWFHYRKIKQTKATLAQKGVNIGEYHVCCIEVGRERIKNLFSKYENSTLTPVKLAALNQTKIKIHSCSV